MSRETRRLLVAAGLALLALWILARLRFPERAASPNPVAPVLTQISPPTTFAELAQETARVEQRIATLLSVAVWQPPGGANPLAFPAWPWRDNVAIALLPTAAVRERKDIGNMDPPTGLALVASSRSAGPPGAVWTPDRLDVPRYLFAASPAPSRPAVGPVYISSLERHRSPAWSMEIWRVPAASGLTPGALVFTAAGEWLGIAAHENGESLIVPAMALFDLAARLNRPRTAPGEFGFQVQQLDDTLAAEIGVAAGSGVIVAWVDPRGPAAKDLVRGDVIESINGARTPTSFAWHVHLSRLGAGEKAALKVRRAGELHDITLTTPSRPARSPALGLTLVAANGLAFLQPFVEHRNTVAFAFERRERLLRKCCGRLFVAHAVPRRRRQRTFGYVELVLRNGRIGREWQREECAEPVVLGEVVHVQPKVDAWEALVQRHLGNGRDERIAPAWQWPDLRRGRELRLDGLGGEHDPTKVSGESRRAHSKPEPIFEGRCDAPRHDVSVRFDSECSHTRSPAAEMPTQS